jgi:hypothetical protein
MITLVLILASVENSHVCCPHPITEAEASSAPTAITAAAAAAAAAADAAAAAAAGGSAVLVLVLVLVVMFVFVMVVVVLLLQRVHWRCFDCGCSAFGTLFSLQTPFLIAINLCSISQHMVTLSLDRLYFLKVSNSSSTSLLLKWHLRGWQSLRIMKTSDCNHCPPPPPKPPLICRPPHQHKSPPTTHHLPLARPSSPEISYLSRQKWCMSRNTQCTLIPW